MRTVLLVEDEQMIREAVSAYLEKQEWKVFQAETGEKALELFEREEIHFVILDLMLPDLTGEEICAALRKTSRVPVIMLTAKTGEEDIVNGLQIGADDYVTKPFSVKQLHARMEAILRRTATEQRVPAQDLRQTDSGLTMDFVQHEVRKQGILLSLTPSEWNILAALMQHPKKVFTRDELIEIAFGADFDGYDRVIDTHIKNLRKKIEEDPKHPVWLKTVHGLGYKFGGEA